MKETNKVKELKERIEDLERTLFYIDMIDRWTAKDYELHDKYYNELQEVKELLIKEIIVK